MPGAQVPSDDVLHIIQAIRPEHLRARRLEPGDHVMRQVTTRQL